MHATPIKNLSEQNRLESLPLIGSWFAERLAEGLAEGLADSLDAWLGVADALNLGALRTVLLADPDATAPWITPADPSSPSSTLGQSVEVPAAAPSSSLSDRAA